MYILLLLLQPFPDLSKCYNFNEASCCNVVHDTAIADFIASFIPEACIRKYPELEELFCFPCSPYESKYYDATTFTLKVCKKFAYKIWNATNDEELRNPTTRFDNCGFMIADNQEEIKQVLKSYGIDLDVYLPSHTKFGFEDFIVKLNFSLYTFRHIQLVDSEDETECFTSGYSLNVNKGLLLLLLFIYYLC